VPPVAYAIFLELKEYPLVRLLLLFVACDIEADALNPQNAINGRRLTT
jgi:hypothetical protein